MAILLLLSGGCNETLKKSRPEEGETTTKKALRLDTADGMLEYLRSQKLPAVKEIEPWDGWQNPGLKITTEHYEIYTTLFEPRVIRDIPAFLENCCKSYSKMIPGRTKTTAKFPVYLFAGRSQWEAFTLEHAGSQAAMYLQIQSGAYYLNGACVAYDIGTDRTFRVLGHECWHQFADRVFQLRLPSWLNEGIAMQFETYTYDKDGQCRFEPAKNNYRLVKLKQALMNEKTIPLEKLLGENPAQAFADSNDGAVTTFYSQCYALIRFLCESDYENSFAGFCGILNDGLTGSWPIEAENKIIAADRRIMLTAGWNKAVSCEMFRHYVDSDLEKAEKSYLDFCEKITDKIRLKQIADKQLVNDKAFNNKPPDSTQ